MVPALARVAIGTTLTLCLSACATPPEPLRPGHAPEPTTSCEASPILSWPMPRLTPTQYRRTIEMMVGPVEGLAYASAASTELDEGLGSFSSDEMRRLLDDAERIATQAMTPDIASRYDACASVDEFDRACAERFLAAFARIAWRRPLEADELTELLGTYDREAVERVVDETALGGARDGLRFALMRVLIAPDFLFRVEIPHDVVDGVAHRTPHQLASRLSFLLLNRGPDETLLDMADAGELETAAQAGAVARDLLFDESGAPRPAAVQRVWQLHRAWLSLSDVGEEDPEAASVEELWALETRAFVEEVTWARGGGVAELLDSGFAVVNDRLAEHYDMPPVEGSELRIVADEERRGVLQQASFLAAHGATGWANAPRRGQAIITAFGCLERVGDPPASAAEVELPDADNARDYFAPVMERSDCAYCHEAVNPPGYALEAFDAEGRWREPEGAIDTVVDIDWLSGSSLVEGPLDLSTRLADEPQVHRCATGWTLRFVVGERSGLLQGEAPTTAETCAIQAMQEACSGTIEQLLAFLESDSFLLYRVEGLAE